MNFEHSPIRSKKNAPHASLVFFFFLFSFFISNAQVYDQEIMTPLIKERIKRSNTRFVMGWTYPFEKNVLSKQGKKSSFEKFDKEGNLIEEVYYNVAGGVNYESSYEYDSKGQEIERVYTSKVDYLTRRWTYKKNEKTGELERWPARTFGSQEHTSFLMDHAGRVVKESRYDKDGLTGTLYFKFDNRGNITEKLIFDGNNNLFEKWVYEYDENNTCIAASAFDADNKLFRSYIYEYDQAGNRVGELVKDGSGNSLQKTKFIYQPYTW